MGKSSVSSQSLIRRLSRRLTACGLAVGTAAGAFLVAAVAAPVTAAHATPSGGPVVLDGMDPVYHSFYQSTGSYISTVLASLHSQASRTSDGSIAVLGSDATSDPGGGTLGSQMATFVSGIMPTPT